MTDNSNRLTKDISKFEMKAIINDCINRNYHIFRAFDVVDGVITPQQYFDEMSKRRKGDSVNA